VLAIPEPDFAELQKLQRWFQVGESWGNSRMAGHGKISSAGTDKMSIAGEHLRSWKFFVQILRHRDIRSNLSARASRSEDLRAKFRSRVGAAPVNETANSMNRRRNRHLFIAERNNGLNLRRGKGWNQGSCQSHHCQEQHSGYKNRWIVRPDTVQQTLKKVGNGECN
jgi:hypothetical protein